MILWDELREQGIGAMEVKGRFTGRDLSNIMPLSMPWMEIDGQMRPEFSHAAAQLSLELAATAYDLKMDDWRAAGWRDFSYQVDNTLLTGAAVNGGGSSRGIGGAISDYFRRLAQARMTRQNPISQIRGALRQREGSDTCKALVMIHHAPGDRYVVAIGFMGTGKRIYDWFSNFRLAEENGMHRGFLQLTQEFEEKCGAISFPETAREMGLEKLTLSDIFDRCRRPGSPFRIWMAGHSQGAAVMQLAAFREIRRGLLRQNLIGFGFASPSVVYQNPGCDISGFPLYHIINADDMTPRVGASLHIGRCRVFWPDEEMRQACYRAVWNDPPFRAMLAMVRSFRDTKDALLWMMALLRALEDLPDAESAAVLTGMVGRMIPERLLTALGGRLDQLIRMLIQKTEQGYMQLSGELQAPPGTVLRLRLRIHDLIDHYGAKIFVRAFLQSLSFPHKLRGTDLEKGVSSYQYIVNQRFAALHQTIWCGPLPLMDGPNLIRETGARRLPAGRFARLSTARNQRRAL